MRPLLGFAVVLLLIAYAGWRYNLFGRVVMGLCVLVAVVLSVAYLLTQQ